MFNIINAFFLILDKTTRNIQMNFVKFSENDDFNYINFNFKPITQRLALLIHNIYIYIYIYIYINIYIYIHIYIYIYIYNYLLWFIIF